jgi:hypothetical protein
LEINKTQHPHNCPNYNKELQYQSKMVADTKYETLTNTAHIFRSNIFAGHMLREEWFGLDKDNCLGTPKRGKPDPPRHYQKTHQMSPSQLAPRPPLYLL